MIHLCNSQNMTDFFWKCTTFRGGSSLKASGATSVCASVVCDSVIWAIVWELLQYVKTSILIFQRSYKYFQNMGNVCCWQVLRNLFLNWNIQIFVSYGFCVKNIFRKLCIISARWTNVICRAVSRTLHFTDI